MPKQARKRRTTRNQSKTSAREPEQWKTGDEPMTAAQRSYLQTLAQAAGQPVPDNLTKAEASKLIDSLRQQAGSSKAGSSPRQAKNKIKDPDNWKTATEPMTAAQRSYLETLANEAGETVEDDLTKSEAAKLIDVLQERTGRRPKRKKVER